MGLCIFDIDDLFFCLKFPVLQGERHVAVLGIVVGIGEPIRSPLSQVVPLARETALPMDALITMATGPSLCKVSVKLSCTQDYVAKKRAIALPPEMRLKKFFFMAIILNINFHTPLPNPCHLPKSNNSINLITGK